MRRDGVFKMKKKMLGFLLSTTMIASSLLTGCGSTGDTQTTASEQQTSAESKESKAEQTADAKQGQDTGEKVHLKWAAWDISLITYWNDLANAYMEKNPNVEIEIVDFGSNDYSNVLATELSGSGTDFDVVSIKDTPSYATLVEKGVLVPLDDYINASGVDLAKYNGVTDQVTVDGSLYELPFRSDVWLVFYNKDIFDAAGIDYPTNDMTVEEYDKLARSLADDTFGSEIYGCHYHTWSSTIQLFGILDGKHSVLDKNYDFMIPYYNMVLAEEDDGICMKYSDLKTEGLHYSAAFSNGNVAMINMGSWFVTTLINNLASGEYDSSLCGNWGIASYPHPDGVAQGTTLGAITGLGMVSESKNKDAAWDFIQWVSGEEGAAILAASGNFPAISNDDVVASIASMDGFPQDQASKDALKTTAVYLEAPYGKDLAAVNPILGTYHEMIMQRECSVEDGIKMMNEEAAKIE